MIDNSKDPLLTLVYNEDGKEFYSHLNPMEISPVRGIAIERARRFLDMNIREMELKKLIKQIKAEAGAGDIVKAFSIVQEIEYRLDFICEETSIFEFVSIYYFLKDEDPKVYNAAITEKKMKMFAEDEKLSSFFLHIGLILIDRFMKLPEVDLRTYMEQNKVHAERIYRFISRST